MEPTPEYVSHNYKAVNEHIDELTRRNRVVTSSRRVEVFGKYAKYASIFIVCLGIMGLLLFWGYSKVVNPRPEIIEKEVVVEKPVSFKPNIYITTNQADNARIDETRAEAARRLGEISSGNKNTNSKSTVYDFVIFKEIPFTQDGFKQVTVGMRYQDADAKLPARQWCYIERGRSNGTSIKVTLAVTENGHTPEDITQDMATALTTSVGVLKSAQGSCLFR
jgi:hypothetical protein